MSYVERGVELDQRSRLQQFYLRFILVAGMLWGGMPFVTAPLVSEGPGISRFAIAAAIFSMFSVLPASALAFWHRRIACVWLTLNGAVLVAILAGARRAGKTVGPAEMIGVAGCIALALFLDFTELRRWPGAIEK